MPDAADWGYEEMCEVAEKIYDQGIEKGIEKGKLENAKDMAINMHKDGMAEDLIAKYANVSVDLVRKWLGLSLA